MITVGPFDTPAVLPSWFIHVIVGRGIPVAVQVNIAPPPNIAGVPTGPTVIMTSPVNNTINILTEV